MINFALLGAGRIGKLHADIINNHKLANLRFIFDTNTKLSADLSKKYNCISTKTASDAINSPFIDAVLIASSTPTHTKFIRMSAKAGKAIFCEKPIDLNIKKVNDCWNNIKKFKVPIQIGFNRRYDAGHSFVKKSVTAGKIGKLEMIVITSRDPAPPPLSYLKKSGGIFRDCSIHDFDLARFILQDDPIVEVFANASIQVSKDFIKARDYDTTMCILKSKKGVLVHINNSRRAVYGYDQRLEVFGSKGMLVSDNISANNVKSFDKKISFGKNPIHHFFIERYLEAYKTQFDDFLKSIIKKTKPNVSFEDGKKALIIANSATESVKYNKLVKLKN
tara:strand:+ start:227 stop:1228 length:1002 start_codon:yes stop_codon:yes gene_type:complete